MRKAKGPEFTHFGSIPFIREIYRKQFSELQDIITEIFKQKALHTTLKPNNPNLFHLTLTMLTLPHKSTQTKTQQVLQSYKQQFYNLMRNTKLTTDTIKYFTFKTNYRKDTKDAAKSVNVIYLDIKKDNEFEKLAKLSDLLIRILLKQEIIVNQELKDMHIEYDHNKGMFGNKEPHITLFRCENLLENNDFLECFQKIGHLFKDKVIQCDHIDISTRWNYDETKFYTPLYRINLGEKIELPPKKQDQNNEK